MELFESSNVLILVFRSFCDFCIGSSYLKVNISIFSSFRKKFEPSEENISLFSSASLFKNLFRPWQDSSKVFLVSSNTDEKPD
ncbi:MAG: hypothetical protein PHE20_00740 [Patescibacteria group bacterium]|nr:hypothetical protein [Patescibacteria group bacterium]